MICILQTYFDEAISSVNQDSLFNLSLNGDGIKYGILDIADIYSGTNAGNLANFMLEWPFEHERLC